MSGPFWHRRRRIAGLPPAETAVSGAKANNPMNHKSSRFSAAEAAKFGIVECGGVWSGGVLGIPPAVAMGRRGPRASAGRSPGNVPVPFVARARGIYGRIGPP